MADQTKDNNATKVEAKSENGTKYETNSIHVNAEDHFIIDVDWKFSDGTYTRLSPELRKKTGIIQYALHKNPPPAYFDYILEIDEEESEYTYRFTDGEPDTYSLNCSLPGHHYIKFDSKSPDIKKIEGRRNPPPPHKLPGQI
jgi:hypothetical protein